MGDTNPRLRFGGSKVRTGCITCKARRVKCDEAKPNCARCAKLGRKCAGYVPLHQYRRSTENTFVIVKYVPTVVNSPSCSPGLDWQEKRSLYYYQSRAAAEIAGAFAPHVWEKLVLRIAQHEAAIKHALIALGALHETFVHSSTFGAVESDFAMQQYCKSIQRVINLDVSASSKSVDVAVLSCVLYTAFESLQGHYQSALQHINSGAKILSEHEAKDSLTASDRYVPPKLMRKLFARLDSQAYEIGEDNLRPTTEYLAHQPLPDLPEAFPGIEKASFAFEMFMNRFLHFLQGLSDCAKPQTSPQRFQEIGMRHAEFVQYFQGWGAAFDKSGFSSSEPSTHLFQAYKAMLGILLNINPALGEILFDHFTPQFAEIVIHAEAFLRLNERNSTCDVSGSQSPGRDSFYSTSEAHSPTSSPSQTSRSSTPYSCGTEFKPSFTLSLGIITPLYVVCSRCRDPVIRQRALHILYTCNRKEGIWDSALSARVAERIIEIEEAGAEVATVTEASQIPEHARVCELDTFFGAGRQGRIKYYKSDVIALQGKITDETECVGRRQLYEETFEW